MKACKYKEYDAAIKLRVENRMSSLAISRELKIAKSTVTRWLKPYPLSKEEIALNRREACKNAYYTTPEERAAKNTASKSLRQSRKGNDIYSHISTTKKGKAGELIFRAKCLLHNMDVYSVETEDSLIDCIVRKHRCQVKSISATTGNISLRTVRRNGKSYRYTDSDVDYIIAVDLITFDCFVLPIKSLSLYQRTIGKAAIEQLSLPNDFTHLES